MTTALKPRRKPSQSRAWMTSIAIQDAFALLLLEKGYEKTSMRDIANVAGVSVGSVYRYFSGKEAVAAMTVRTWVRKLSTALSSAVDDVVQADTIVDALVKQTLLVSAELPSAEVMVDEVLLALDGYLQAVCHCEARKECAKTRFTTGGSGLPAS